MCHFYVNNDILIFIFYKHLTAPLLLAKYFRVIFISNPYYSGKAEVQIDVKKTYN